MKELILHAGFSKTGSSALQSWLALNECRLRDQGVNYGGSNQDAKNYRVNSGNGAKLYSFLKNDKGNPQSIIDFYFSSFEIAIISSEFFSLLDERELKRLNIFCENENIKIKVIAYIRNIYDYYYSSYVQSVKRHGTTRSFELYVSKRIDKNTFNPLKGYMLLKKHVPIALIHYESAIDDVAKYFCEYVNLDYNNLIPMKARKVNRTLSFVELRMLNKFILAAHKTNLDTELFSRLLSEALITNYPNVSSAPVYNEKVHAILENEYRDTLYKLNKDIVAQHRFELQMIGDIERFDDGKISFLDKTVTLVRMLKSLFRELATYRALDLFKLIKNITLIYIQGLIQSIGSFFTRLFK